MKHVLFTEPADIAAGRDVTIYYNPQDTPLSGTQDVYLTVSAPWPTPVTPASLACRGTLVTACLRAVCSQTVEGFV